ncbi:heparinase II/III family protein [Rhodothermus sp. AH-315-K08]|nr:heparinase II/III family protein [Rhodothermus sp. AH-315-K08]
MNRREDHFRYLVYLLRNPRYYRFLLGFAGRKVMVYLSILTRGRIRPLGRKVADTPARERLQATGGALVLGKPAPAALDRWKHSSPKESGSQNVATVHVFSEQRTLNGGIFDSDSRDPEQAFFVHRFSWLYEVLFRSPDVETVAACWELVRHWIRRYPLNAAPHRFDSYSISERVVVWLYLYRYTAAYAPPGPDVTSTLVSSIQEQLKHLAAQLEFRGPETNNHVLNNARCLYVSGVALGLGNLTQLGRDLFLTEYHTVFEGAEYLEGSSHYRLLTTKNILDVREAALIEGDGQFLRSLNEYVEGPLARCRELFESGFPLLGDVSPDAPPEWLDGMPFSNHSSKNSPFFGLHGYNLPETEPLVRGEKTTLLHLSGNPFAVWATVRNGGVPCHGHNDNGSVVVHLRRDPLIIDLGRTSYLDSSLGRGQTGAPAHNMPLVDGHPVDIPRSSALSASGLSSLTDVLHKSDARAVYEITYAYSRIVVRRSVEIEGGTCTITDELQGRATAPREYLAWYHFSNRPLLSGKQCAWDGNLRMDVSGDRPIVLECDDSFQASTAYGHSSPAFSVLIRSRLAPGDRVTIRLEDGQ